MRFFVIDPYLFLYPDTDPSVPLERKKTIEFLLRLNDWSKVFEKQDFVGLSDTCMDILKRHPRSLLNGLFVSNLYTFLGDLSQMVSSVLTATLSRLKRESTFSSALNTIDRDHVTYQFKNIDTDPSDFHKRLPSEIQDAFLWMLGDLAFAKSQRWYPIEAFKELAFPTVSSIDASWLKTKASVDYDSDLTHALVLRTPCESYLQIVRDPRTEAETQPIKKVCTVQTAVLKVSSLYPDDIFISDELERDIARDNVNIPQFEQLERALNGLVAHWLPAYRIKRTDIGDSNARAEASRAFRSKVPFEISGESETVQRSAKLRNERRICLNGVEEGYALLHVKIGKMLRVHFEVCRIEDKYCIVLGPIAKHLATARY